MADRCVSSLRIRAHPPAVLTKMPRIRWVRLSLAATMDRMMEGLARSRSGHCIANNVRTRSSSPLVRIARGVHRIYAHMPYQTARPSRWLRVAYAYVQRPVTAGLDWTNQRRRRLQSGQIFRISYVRVVVVWRARVHTSARNRGEHCTVQNKTSDAADQDQRLGSSLRVDQ
jgi:hypothetical protein